MNAEQSTFSLEGGYPYNGIESAKALPNRIRISLDEDNVISIADMGDFVSPAEDDKDAQISFLMGRAFDFMNALNIAEEQLASIFTEDPFIPEDLNFELSHKPETVHDVPIRMYSAKYDDSVNLFREPQDLNSLDYDPTKWILQKKDEGKFTDIKVRLTSRRVAFITLNALGVKMREPKEVEA